MTKKALATNARRTSLRESTIQLKFPKDLNPVYKRHKVARVAVLEAALKNIVLRVHVEKFNLEDKSVQQRLLSASKGKKPKLRSPYLGQLDKKDNYTKRKAFFKMLNDNLENNENKKSSSLSNSLTSTKRALSDSEMNGSEFSSRTKKTRPEEALSGHGHKKALKESHVPSAENTQRPECSHYILSIPPEKTYESRKLNYNFSKLAVDVRSLRLPSPTWKIKIFMKNKAISAISFTNKEEIERALKFTALNDAYDIVIDNRKAVLLGSPITIDSRRDVEVLLDILHTINAQNPMIMYT